MIRLHCSIFNISIGLNFAITLQYAMKCLTFSHFQAFAEVSHVSFMKEFLYNSMLNWAFWKHVTVSMYQQSKCSYFEDVHQSYFHAFNLLFYPLAIPKISDIFDDLFNPHIKSRLSTREWQLSF